MFLSANNFFWRVQRRNEVRTRTRKWRALGRPESALIGVEYARTTTGASSARSSCAPPIRHRGSSPAAKVFAAGAMDFGGTALLPGPGSPCPS